VFIFSLDHAADAAECGLRSAEVLFYCVDTMICFRLSRDDESPHRCVEFPAWQKEMTSRAVRFAQCSILMLPQEKSKIGEQSKEADKVDSNPGRRVSYC